VKNLSGPATVTGDELHATGKLGRRREKDPEARKPA